MQEILKQQTEKFLARYPKIFFCHVPKCAGVSLSKAIYSAVYPSMFKATRFTSHIDLTSSRISSDLLDMPMMTARECQLISQLSSPHMLYTNGHCIARPAVVNQFASQWYFLTILRDPVDRFISEFVYNKYKASQWQKHDEDIEQYVDSDKGISAGLTYARYFSGMNDAQQILADPQAAIDAAVANLRRFAVVGTLDDMPGWSARFNQRFGTKLHIANQNTSPNQGASAQITSDSAMMAAIAKRCEVDQAIYDQVKTLAG